MKIVWYSYAPDYLLLERSIEAAKIVYPEARLVVALDINERTEPDVDAHIERTTFNRGMNLRHVEAPEGIASHLRSHCFDAVLKCDSDVMLMSRKWSRPVTNGTHKIAGWSHSKRVGFGAAYIMSYSCVNAVADSFRHCPPLNNCEDIEIIGRAKLWCGMNGLNHSIVEIGEVGSANPFRQFRQGASMDGAEAIHYGLINRNDAVIAMDEALTRLRNR